MSKWRTDVLYKCAAAHPKPMVAFEWASEIDEAGSYEELAREGAKYKPNFATMEAKVVAGVMGIVPGNLMRKVEYTKTVYAMKKPPQMITGR